MGIKNLLLVGLSALAIPAVANAAITVGIYTDQSGAASNVTIADAAGLTANATVNVGAINFSTGDSTVTTVGAFLHNPAGLGSTVANHILNNTYFLFTGSTFLKNGLNSFVIPHDDGIELSIPGAGYDLSRPGATSVDFTPINVTAPKAGVYAFTLAYGECCGGPAAVSFDVNGQAAGTPEPAMWAMMLTGFGLVGATMRRRVKTVAA